MGAWLTYGGQVLPEFLWTDAVLCCFAVQVVLVSCYVLMAMASEASQSSVSQVQDRGPGCGFVFSREFCS